MEIGLAGFVGETSHRFGVQCGFGVRGDSGQEQQAHERAAKRRELEPRLRHTGYTFLLGCPGDDESATLGDADIVGEVRARAYWQKKARVSGLLFGSGKLVRLLCGRQYT